MLPETSPLPSNLRPELLNFQGLPELSEHLVPSPQSSIHERLPYPVVHSPVPSGDHITNPLPHHSG